MDGTFYFTAPQMVGTITGIVFLFLVTGTAYLLKRSLDTIDHIEARQQRQEVTVAKLDERVGFLERRHAPRHELAT